MHLTLLSTTLLSAMLMSGAAFAQATNTTVEHDHDVNVEATEATDAGDTSADEAREDVAATGEAADATTTTAGAGNAEEFAIQAAMSDMYEIESSKLAMKHAKNAEVKKYAQAMVTDHNKSSAALRAALAQSGLKPNLIKAELDGKHRQMLDALEGKIAAEDFDEEYMDAQENAHADAIKLFESYAANGENAQLKAFAEATLPTLRQHREHADKVELQVATWR